MSTSPPDRQLLVGGERLRIAVDAPPSGGGDKFEPQTAQEARAALLPMIRAVADTAATLPPRLRGDRVYVEARLLPNYLAASHFPGQLLTQVGAVPVGSRADRGLLRTKTKATESATRRLILAVSDDGLDALSDLIEQPGQSRSERQAAEELRKLDRLSVASTDEVVLARPTDEGAEVTWEAVLHPSTSLQGDLEPLDAATLDKWFALVERLGGRSHRDFVRRVGGLTFAPIALSASQVDELARFNPLRALRPMPSIRPRPRFGPRAVSERLSPPVSAAPVAPTPVVAVFDGGVHTGPAINALFPTPCRDLTPEAPDNDDLDHGTGVTGAVLYGLADPGAVAPQPPCPVESFRVLPAPLIPDDLDGYWVLDRIVAAVKENGCDIVNLSLGPSLAVEDSIEPNRWTSELDHLAWEHDVLFVVAAGNDGDQDRDLGLHRVQVPGDMVNGITVGACDTPPPTTGWQRAPYSSMGPGRHGNRIQPAGLQFGGTDEAPFPLLRVDGSFLDAHGTSFAAPLLTHALADLATRLPNPTPSVLRAFTVHYAEQHRTHRKLLDEVGHGRLALDFSPALGSQPNEAHVLFVDEIERGQLLGYQLPVPAGAAGRLSLTLTLAYGSPVEPSEPTEYTRASLELALRPHRRRHRFTAPAGVRARPVVDDFTSPEGRRLINEGWQLSQEPVTKSLAARRSSDEAALRDAGKWETVRHHRVNLAGDEIEFPRLELSYLARRGGLLDGSPSAVPFAILVSIVDRSGGIDLYDRVCAEFPALLPVSVSRTRPRVRT